MQSFDSKDESIPLYVDLLSNGGFKAVFGDVNNKDVVMSIINVLLPSHRKVVDIEYLPVDRLGPVVDVNKEFQYDFLCRDTSGAVFIVEMQRYHEAYWFKRCVSYASRVYDRQNRKGGVYDVPPVYLIGLMGTEINHPDKEFWRDRYVSEYTFREKECHDLLDETIVIIFAELAGFNKSAEECQTELEKMLYLLKNIGRMDRPPRSFENSTYDRIFEACRLAGFSEDKRIKYDNDMNDERRLRGIELAYRRIGYEDGMRDGMRDGMKNAILRLHSKGMISEQISTLLDIDLSEVESILAEK